MLEPLTFPEPPNILLPFSFVPWENEKCSCPLCDQNFDLSVGKDLLFTHLKSSHKLYVEDPNSIASIKGYFDYWKIRFSEQPFSSFCTILNFEQLENDKYYVLSELHPEDSALRKGLAAKRLVMACSNSKVTPKDRFFVKQCLFCRHVEKTSRYDYLTHLSYQHNLQLGIPDNLVFIDKLLDKLEEKLNKLECIYCEHIFRDRSILKEHMRKKFHKRINRKNKEYDRFYVINYVEGGHHREDIEESQPEDAWSQWREEGVDWSDWLEEPPSIVCLFCPFSCKEWEDIINHMFIAHNFSYYSVMKKLNFYEQVKIVNFIRREIRFCRCSNCQSVFPNPDSLLEHMTQSNHFTLPDRKNWDHPE
ncbi:zinc finger protein, putative [Pediculus humanus corporis]|uniref:Zinc finger protein, putative n=1 Tax=Pediculus humanus subsp. corporis TaxID=121224 RepID=E0V9I3_PEDHC|nr:zinc finger protein, putative [Pediculus humanus corporis]EEB10039.1 zinc finger protein, putative [Pediculus humanus corporis]